MGKQKGSKRDGSFYFSLFKQGNMIFEKAERKAERTVPAALLNLKGDFSMPYIAIKSFPKDQATKEAVAEKINEIFLEVWGCPQEAITISIEDITPADWEEKIVKTEIDPKKENMMILSGKRCYKR